MRKLLKMAVLVTSFVAGSALATPIASGPVDADAYISIKGYDIAWASPCGAGIFGNSCSTFDLSIQGAYGWKIMTAALFQSLGLSFESFAVDYTSANTQGYNGKNYVKASQWFSTYTHIDVQDGKDGFWSFADQASISFDPTAETIAYRVNTPNNSVPTPAPLALLGLGLVGLVLRRKAK